MLSSLASAQVFTITDMGPNVQFISGMNAAGQVIGNSACSTCLVTHAFVFTKATGMRLLPDHNATLTCDSSNAADINKFGDIVGSCRIGDGSLAVLWPHGGGMLDLGELGPVSYVSFSQAQGINDSRQIVGGSNGKAFLWTALGGMRDLGSIPNTYTTYAASIDADGYVIGNAALINEFGDDTHPWAWTAAGGAQEILSLPVDATAYRIRNGTVVGFDCNADCHSEGPPGFSFIWRNHHGPTFIGMSPNRTVGTFALAINSMQQVVGSNARAFLWIAGATYDLNKLTSAPAWLLTQAEAINDLSQIAGIGLLHGVNHGFLLTMVPKHKLISVGHDR